MMPCVAKDTSDLSHSPVRVTSDRPKNIYKPKYHAFSIDSLVGNNDKTDDKNTSNSSESQQIDLCLRKPSTSTPTPPPSRPPTSPTPPFNGHKSLNDNSNTSTKSYDIDDSIDGSAKLLVKNDGILRSYMTHNQSVGPHLNTSHQNTNYNHCSEESLINQSISHRFADSIQNSDPKYEHILSLRSNLSDNHNSSPERVPFGGSSLQTSPFNSSQYYCNQLYCRPFEERLIQSTHPFLPQVCDYKLLSSKSPDICCQSTYSAYRKPKRIRTAFSPGQLLNLEEVFERNRYVVGCERKQLARDLNLSETQIKVWFQNRRTKHKREKHQIGSKRHSSSSHLMSTGSTIMSMNCGNNSDDNDVDDYDRKY